MRWYRLAADPFAFDPGPQITKAPTAPSGRKWSPPIKPTEDLSVPPPTPNRETVINEIVRMLSGSEAPVEQLIGLRDQLRSEGFWQGMMAQPGQEEPSAPFMAPTPEQGPETSPEPATRPGPMTPEEFERWRRLQEGRGEYYK